MSSRPRKSGTRISILVLGLVLRISLMQSAKCCAPPSRRSSRSTEVMTTYFNFMAATDSARCLGSSLSSSLGRPCPTSQKGQRRVQMSPIIMKVAVPWLKHSPMLGQEASSHTVCIFWLRRISLISKNFWLLGTLARIQLGFFSFSSSGTTLMGMRAVLLAPLCFTPWLLSKGLVSVVISGLSLMFSL